jgi:RNA polymerase sigma-70 factor, ECF subfamily
MIARNNAAEFYRYRKLTEELPETLEHHDSPQAEAKEILAAIRSLPEAYRETLVLRLVEGMTGLEISEQTGLTPLSVRVNLHRGMKLLRQKLGIED